MKRLLLLLLLWTSPVFAQAHFVMSNFKDTANPLSENSNWKNGLAVGLKWGNVQTTGITSGIGINVLGHAYGTNTTNGTCALGNPPSSTPGCNDSTAIVSGVSWGNDQIACATVYIGQGLNRTSGSGNFYEIELRVRTTIAANLIKGYEMNFSLRNDGTQYAQIVRWDGDLNNFSVLGGATTPPVLNNGDIVCASAVGTTLSAYVFTSGGGNTPIVTRIDATYASGSPGVAFFNQNGVTGDNVNFGLTNFWASDSFAIAATCNQADVATAMTAAVANGTVLIPAGTCPWTTGVSLSGKAVNVMGAGGGSGLGYSSDTLTLATGSKTITTQSGLPINNGETLKVIEVGNRQNFLQGTVTSYSGTSLVLNATTSGGTCGTGSSGSSPSNCKRWLVTTLPNTTITNNMASGNMFNVTEDTTNHTNFAFFKIAEGTGVSTVFNINRSVNGRAVLVHDTYEEQTGSPGAQIHLNVNRGVFWNNTFESTPFSMAPVAVQVQAPTLTVTWSDLSTMGVADLTGESNSYFENNVYAGYLNSSDFDDNSRSVWRHNLMDQAGFGTHGYDTSAVGQRHFEYYNNYGQFNGYSDLTTFNMSWWMFVRGGTYVVHDNTLTLINSTDFPNKSDVNMIAMPLQRDTGSAGIQSYEACWNQGGTPAALYHMPRQVGYGRVTGLGVDGKGFSTDPNGVYIGDIEPAYLWNNNRPGSSIAALSAVNVTDYGNTASDSCQITRPGAGTTDTSANYIQANREYFNSATTAKPGYAPFTYPHPFENTFTQIIVPQNSSISGGAVVTGGVSVGKP